MAAMPGLYDRAAANLDQRRGRVITLHFVSDAVFKRSSEDERPSVRTEFAASTKHRSSDDLHGGIDRNR
jgi:hypothetical protein